MFLTSVLVSNIKPLNLNIASCTLLNILQYIRNIFKVRTYKTIPDIDKNTKLHEYKLLTTLFLLSRDTTQKHSQ